MIYYNKIFINSEGYSMNGNDRKRIFSGVQPSGNLTIGNYLGAINNWKKFEDEYDPFYCVVDMHAITVRQDPAVLRRRTYEILALYIASGLDPEKNTMFVQSHVPCHAELAWVLNCFTMFGELSRMTQFKDKSAKNASNINAGLFDYPVLMASDILLYQASLVPVGQDLFAVCRDSETELDVAEGHVALCETPRLVIETAADHDGDHVFTLDEKDVVMRKFKRAVTDSDTRVRYAEGKDGVNNLMTIYSAFSGKTFDEIEQEFEGKGYGDFKTAVGETVADSLEPVRNEYKRLMEDKPFLESVMKQGAEKAEYIARKTLSKVYKKVGFVPRIR